MLAKKGLAVNVAGPVAERHFICYYGTVSEEMFMRSYFAGGCFWCVTPIFKMYGVDKVVCGYSGGDEPNPKYEDVKAQKTGHRETIMLEYDPAKVSYETLLEI